MTALEMLARARNRAQAQATTGDCEHGVPYPCGACHAEERPPWENAYGKAQRRQAAIDTTLAERGKRYGEFKDQAVIGQGLADVARAAPRYGSLAPDMKEALSVIFNKIARILNGDPEYSDSWHDIAGYATLVDKRLKDMGK